MGPTNCASNAPMPHERERALAARFEAACAAGGSLDLTRGKPSADQLDLADGLDGVLGGDYRCADGTDARNYGLLDGIPEMKALAAVILGVLPDEVLVGGNASLTLMYQYVAWAHGFGPDGRAESAWGRRRAARFICPVPGYDRHYSICEEFGIEMVPVPMHADGPDMDAVERLVRADPDVVGMWCVPRFSNPGGEIYAEAVVRRVARLARLASPGFRVMWDNAYAVHDLALEAAEEAPPLANVMDLARELGTTDSIVAFGSTSKVTMAGCGVAFMAASPGNLAAFRTRLAVETIGPDKVNQLRHVRFLRDLDGVREHMRRHAAVLRPRFELVERRLAESLAARDGRPGFGHWTRPSGGYFVSFFTEPGLASRVVAMAARAGVKLTPAGAAYPHGRDPDDAHIRLAPSFPSLAELDRAMEVFVLCVELATLRRRRGTNE